MWGDWNSGYEWESPNPAADAGKKGGKKGGGSKAGGVGGGIAAALGNAIGAYFDALSRGATSGDAAFAAKQQLAGGLANTLTQGITGGLGGGLAATLGGPILGGLISWGISAAFGLNKPRPVEWDEPKPVIITNVLDFIKLFTLPSSAYFVPTGGNTSAVNLAQQNTINISGGPRTGSRVIDALTSPQLAQQARRGLA